jgi:hypothetical protein
LVVTRLPWGGARGQREATLGAGASWHMLNPMNLLVIAAACALAFCVAVIVGTVKGKPALLAFAVGVSGALVGIQVLQVHAFTITVVLWIVFAKRRFVGGCRRHSCDHRSHW